MIILKIKRLVYALTSLAVIVMVLAASAPVLAKDTTLPEEFFGEIRIDSLPAPEGTEITARIGGLKRGQLTTIAEGSYGGTETFAPRLVVEGQDDEIGQEITFFINGRQASRSATFVPGQVKEISLSALAYPLDKNDARIKKALTYLKGAQESDGSIGSYVVTSWVIMAVKAAGQDPHDWKSGKNSLVSYLEKNSEANVDPDLATDCERTILAIVAAGENPRAFGGHDYVADLLAFFDGDQMGDADRLNDDCWGILALKSIGEGSDIIPQIAGFLKDNQNSDGGWNWATGGESDADNTAAAVSALIAAGISPNSQVLSKAAEYLKSQQQSNGGFLSEGTTNSGVDSWVVRAIRDLEQDPTAEEWQNNSANAVEHLLSLQDSDGAFNWSSSKKNNPEWMTAYAIPALLGASFPVDTQSPTISDLKPANGSSITSKNPAISATLADATAGIDLTSIELKLDGSDVTGEADITASKISYTAHNLKTGTHTVNLQVNDLCGNSASQVWSFKIKASGGGGSGGGGGSSGANTTPTPTPAPSSTPTPSATPAPSATPVSSAVPPAIPTPTPIPTGVVAGITEPENTNVGLDSQAVNLSPASFILSGLAISPAEADLNAAVMVRVTIANEGDLDGDFTADLLMDGKVAGTQVLPLTGHTRSILEFALTAKEAGLHTLTIGGLSGQFSVRPAPVASATAVAGSGVNRSEVAKTQPATNKTVGRSGQNSSNSYIYIAIGAVAGAAIIGLLLFVSLRKKVKR